MQNNLNKPATKGDFETLARTVYENMVTKEEFHQEINDIKEQMATKADVQGLYVGNDMIISMLRKKESEDAGMKFQIDRHEKMLKKIVKE